MTRKRAIQPLKAAVIAVAFGGVMGCDRDIRPAPESDQRQAQVSIYNATNDAIPLEIQSLNPNFSVSCDLVGSNPSRYLGEEHLSSVAQEVLYSGIERSLNVDPSGSDSTPEASSQCYFSFLTTEDARLRPLAASWPRNLSEKTFYTDVDAPADINPEAQTLIIEGGYHNVDDDDMRPWRHRPCGVDFQGCDDDDLRRWTTPPPGAWYYWSVMGDYPIESTWDPVDLSAMPIADDEREGCNSGRENTPLSWDEAPSGVWRVIDVEAFSREPDNDDGQAPSQWQCHNISLVQNDSDDTWSVCGSQRLARQIRSEEKQGEVYLTFFSEHQYGSPPAAYKALTVEIERRTLDGEPFETETIDLIRGHGIPEHLGIDWRADLQIQCDPRREIADCEQIVAPIQLELDMPVGNLTIAPGETYFLDPAIHRRVEFVRGMYRFVSDLRCQDEQVGPTRLSHPGTYLELIYYSGISLVGEQ